MKKVEVFLSQYFGDIQMMKSVPPLDKSTIMETDDKEDVVEYAYKCTKEEAEKYPQFRWVALEEL